MAGSDPMFILPALHELEFEVMEEVWGQGYFARRMAALDPQSRQQLNELAHRG